MGGRVVEGTGLENRQTRKRLEGSNPSPSANSAFFCRRPALKAPQPEFSIALFQGRKSLRLGHNGLIVMEEAAPERERRHEDRQNGDQTHTHTSPLRRVLILTGRTTSIGTTFRSKIG